jgi:predicted dinucleotide-binding enzyme
MERRAFIATLAALSVPAAWAQKPMRIGVVGSGKIGSTIGGLWVKAGHEVMFSDRDADQVARATKPLGPRARAGSVAEAAAFGDAVLVAVPWGALPAVQKQVGAQLNGRVVIDPNNPIPSRDGEAAAQAQQKGAAVTNAALLPGARLVRTFNSWSWLLMQNEANRPAPRMAMPVAADDPGALKLGLRLVQDAGFDAVAAGSLAASKAFDLGSAVSGRVLTSAELRQALQLKP